MSLLDPVPSSTSSDGLEQHTFLTLIVVHLLGAVSAVLAAWALHTLWRWFVLPQYGAGPTKVAWFGILTMAGLLWSLHAANAVSMNVVRPEYRHPKNRTLLHASLLRLLMAAISVGVTVGIAWLGRAIFL